jgi:hypothetical protein
MAALAAVALTASSVLAQAPPPAGGPAEAPVVSPASLGLFVYAAKNQDKAQQQKDEGECFAWAKQQTNIDPLAPPAPPQQAQQPAKQGPDGSAARGAARGAAAGATVASIADEDTGDGAAKGAAVGAVRGKRKAKKEQKQAAQQAQQQAQQQTQALDQEKKATFNKAFGACLEGRGYSVK